MTDDRELTADERERLAIWKDMMHMYNESMNLALHQILQNDQLLTMPKRELQGIQQRFAGLTTKLQEVAGRDQ